MEIVIKKKSLSFFLATVNNFSKERQIKAPHLEAIRGFGLTQIGVSESFFLRHLSQQRGAIVVGTGAHGTAVFMAINALAGSSVCPGRIPPAVSACLPSNLEKCECDCCSERTSVGRTKWVHL